jgi:benzoyl-CoA reductase/2-hydroxyglutaryl-CoA dehydratase subunit BcrC/BadD/HgdB
MDVGHIHFKNGHISHLVMSDEMLERLREKIPSGTSPLESIAGIPIYTNGCPCD